MNAARADLKAIARLNLRASGILLKRVPMSVLAEGRAGDRATEARARLAALGWKATAQDWGRGGLDGAYLQELLQGMPWVKNGNLVVALKHADAAGDAGEAVGGQRRLVPVGMLVYGTFQPRRSATVGATTRTWNVALAGVGSNSNANSNGSNGSNANSNAGRGGVGRASAERTAEIEGVIVSRGILAAGVGAALFEYAVGDIASRRRHGRPRYDRVVLFTNKPRNGAHKMRQIAERYGFRRASYRLREGGADRTADLTRRGFADGPATSIAMVSSLGAGRVAALRAAMERMVDLDVCPTRRAGNPPLWQLCQ